MKHSIHTGEYDVKKILLPTLIMLVAVAAVTFATNYEWVRQGSQNNRVGFGAVVSAASTGSVAISSCDGMASVDALEACQIGTGNNTNDNSFQYRDSVILEEEGILGIAVYGNMMSKYIIWGEEFNYSGYVAGSDGVTTNGSLFSETANQTPWLATIVDGDSDDDEVIAIDDAVNSILKIETTDKANDTIQVQLNGEQFLITSGYKMWFKCRFAIEDVSADNFACGLTLKSATDVIGTPPADGIWFQLDNDGNVDYHVSQNSTDTTADTGVDLDDGDYCIVAFHYDGTDLQIAVNGTQITNLVDNGTTVVFPDDEELTPFIAIETTDTGKDYALIDYIGVVSERQ